ncbi:MAG: hypothetical protein ACOCQR_01985 [bacterium]
MKKFFIKLLIMFFLITSIIIAYLYQNNFDLSTLYIFSNNTQQKKQERLQENINKLENRIQNIENTLNKHTRTSNQQTSTTPSFQTNSSPQKTVDSKTNLMSPNPSRASNAFNNMEQQHKDFKKEFLQKETNMNNYFNSIEEDSSHSFSDDLEKKQYKTRIKPPTKIFP